MKDANKAIKEEFGYEPPYKITYHISDKNHIVFTLPPEDGAIDDNSLDNVAGGQAVATNSFGKGLNLRSRNSGGICGYMCYDPSARLF